MRREAKAPTDAQSELDRQDGFYVDEVRELLDLVARSLRPIYPLQSERSFDDLLSMLDH